MKLNKMIISITNIWSTQVIVKKITIEKIISSTSKKTLDKCMTQTWSPNSRQMILGISITKRLLGDRGTNNHLMATK
jgi:hypothetical protein